MGLKENMVQYNEHAFFVDLYNAFTQGAKQLLVLQNSDVVAVSSSGTVSQSRVYGVLGRLWNYLWS